MLLDDASAMDELAVLLVDDEPPPQPQSTVEKTSKCNH